MGLFDWLFGKKETAPTPGRSDFGSGNLKVGKTSWQVGDRVLAKWADAFFYPGQVRDVAGDKCQIQFDDGDGAWVPKANVCTPDIVVGSRVFARIGGGPQYLPAVVREQKGEKIQVHYDHGVDEWTTFSLVRVRRGGAEMGEDPQAGFQPNEPMKQQIDLGEPIEDDNWRIGDRVLARWLDFFWYPGSILALGTKGFHILYDDGDQRVVHHANLMPLTVEEGESLFIRPKNEPQRMYHPAHVTRVSGETIDVEFEEGTRETNTRVTRARFWRCPVRVTNFPFDEGDRVLAYDCDGCVYPAEIVSINDDRVIVQYLDGPERMLTPELIRRFDMKVGMKVECRWKGGPNYLPGKLTKVEGERVHMHYDDGDEEWNSIRLVRIPPENPIA